MDAAAMEDDWFARNMPGNIRTAEPAAESRGTVPQFQLDALYPQRSNHTSQVSNPALDIQHLMRLNQNSPTSPALNGHSTDSPTQMLLRLLGLLPGNNGGDLSSGFPGVFESTPTFKRAGLPVDSVDASNGLSNGQLNNIQELLRNQPQGLQLHQGQSQQPTSAQQLAASEALGFVQRNGTNGLDIPDLDVLRRNTSLGSSLQQQAAAQLQQHASGDNRSISQLGVLSLLDPTGQNSLLRKQPDAQVPNGTRPSNGGFHGADDFLTHRDLLGGDAPANPGSVMDSVRSNGWGAAVAGVKQEPGRDGGLGGPPAHNGDGGHGSQEPAGDSGADKNMQDLLESVQRHNPVDARGWQEVAVDVNVDTEKWPELKQCYENFRDQHPHVAPALNGTGRVATRSEASPGGRRAAASRPSAADQSLDRPSNTPNKHGRRINPRKGIPMHIMATYALLRLPDHEGNLSDMSAKIEENAFFCKQLDWTPRPGTKTYPRWKDALVGCFKPGRYPHLKKTTRKKEGLTVYALIENVIPEKSCLKPSMLTDVDPASLPPDFDINNPLVPLRNANSRAMDTGAPETTSVVTTGIQPMAGAIPGHGPLSGKLDSGSRPGSMDAAGMALNGMSGAFPSGGRASMGGLPGSGGSGGLAGADVQQGSDLAQLPGGMDAQHASALIAAAMQQQQQTGIQSS